MSKLNPNAQKWVDGLRSGKYKQGRNCLRRGDKFCCLGVGCEVAIENGVHVTVEIQDIVACYGGRSINMPEEVLEWIGINPGKGQDDLICKNDNALFTFAEIADYIEANAEELGVSA